MKWPPYLLKLRIQNQHHAFGLWLPLCLIMPVILVFLLAVFLILLPFALLVMLFTWRLGWWRPIALGMPALFRLLCSLPGLRVDVEGKAGHVYIAFY
jgi:hypothetical protein